MKIRCLTILFLLVGSSLHSNAGGLLTRTNQSATYSRMLSRNASMDIDAVYYNPAGLFKFDDGWHFSLNNLTRHQEDKITSQYSLLRSGYYDGEGLSEISPSLFLLYKKKSLTLSFAWLPVVSEVPVVYGSGIPSLELGPSSLKRIAGVGITDYRADISFTARSVFGALQAGANYDLGDDVSVFMGARIVAGRNVYNGYIRNIGVKVDNQFYPASVFFEERGNAFREDAANAVQVVDRLNQQMDEYGTTYLTLSQLYQSGFITAEDKNGLLGFLVVNGMPSANENWTVLQVRNGYRSLITEKERMSAILLERAGSAADQEIAHTQKGVGWAPVLGICYSPSDQLSVSFRYEHKTRIRLSTNWEEDETGLFYDEQIFRSDIPSLFAFGTAYQPYKWLETHLSFNLYGDKFVSWGFNFRDHVYKRKTIRRIEDNSWDAGLGFQFNVKERLSFSVGGLYMYTGPAGTWQSDFRYELSSVTGAAGLQWRITPQVTLDAGFFNTFYDPLQLTFNDPDTGNYNEVYNRTSLGFGMGLSYSIFKGYFRP